MSTAYDKLDKQLARPAHPTYDSARESYFVAHAYLVGLAEWQGLGLAEAERHAERSGWAPRWTRSPDDDSTAVQLLDADGTVMGMLSGINPAGIDTDFARAAEAYVTARVLDGDPRALFASVSR